MGALRRPPFLLPFFSAVGVGIFLCRLPLLETLGYEYALAAALTVSLLGGTAAAALPAQLRRRCLPTSRSLFDVYLHAAGLSLLIALGMLTVSILNGVFRVPFCDLPLGLTFYFLMPMFSALIAAALGLTAGLITSSVFKAVVVYVAIYLIALCSGLYSFYSTPAVFVFNPFAGYFPGVLYDRIIRPDVRLLTFRLGTLIDIAAVLLPLAALYDSKRIAAVLGQFNPRGGKAKAAFGGVFLAAVFHLLGSTMGHRTGRGDLEDHLPRQVSTNHLDLFFPEDADLALVKEAVKDAEFNLHQVLSYFGVELKHRVAVFVFRNADDKARLMGAGDTNVAKPWRREVYVTLERPPHSVLRHELAHAVSADFAPGPFAVAGKWQGVLPNPGLIEGLATAAGGGRGELTLHQWARAMDVIGLLPSLEKLVGFGFFDLAAASAYTASGSFCDWIKRRFGAATLIRAYRTGDFAAATQTPLHKLETAWKSYLASIPLLKTDKIAAKARFDRPPIIRTRCVHTAAALCDLGQKALGRHDFTTAARLFETAYQKSGFSTETKQALFFAANEAGDWRRVRETAAEALQRKETLSLSENALREILLDLDMSEQKDRAYAASYETLAASAETEDKRRLLEVKAHLARTGVDDPRIFDVLSLAPGSRAVNPTAAALLIATEATSRPDDPIRAYLLARQFFNAEDYNQTLRLLSRAETIGLFTAPDSLRFAARMMRGDALLALEKFDAASLVFSEIAADTSVREGLREEARDRADRAVFYKTLTR